MTTFISHAFQNRAEFDNVADALVQRQVAYWNPADIRPGASLREQLRAAVERCDACVFVATRDAVASSWCGAELGAFWGAGKPIIVYVAEASMVETELPPIVQGDAYERRIARVADRAKEIGEQAGAVRTASTDPAARPVSQLTVEQLEKLIVGAVSLGAAASKEDRTPASFRSVEAAARQVAGSVLSGFRTAESIARAGDDDWRNQILWVDDRPENNVSERQAMEAMGLVFTLATSTDAALAVLAGRRFAAVISDMGRAEGPREGYVLLEAIRATDRATPFFIYAGSGAVSHRQEAAARGAQGSTNRARELVDMVVAALPLAR